jgi:hypothetical protein
MDEDGDDKDDKGGAEWMMDDGHKGKDFETGGRVDEIQEWKARMKEMERRKMGGAEPAVGDLGELAKSPPAGGKSPPIVDAVVTFR